MDLRARGRGEEPLADDSSPLAPPSLDCGECGRDRFPGRRAAAGEESAPK